MKPTFFARKLKFGEGSYRPLRQIFDQRIFQEKGRIVRVARDVYTAHYFDGWGEWLEARCSSDGKEEYRLLLDDCPAENASGCRARESEVSKGSSGSLF
jgi:hypothetical protein